MSIEPTTGRLDLMTNDRSWSGNTLSAVGMAWTGPGPTTGALPTNLEIYFGRVTP